MHTNINSERTEPMCHHKYCLTSGKEEIEWRTKRCYAPAKFYLLYPPFISSKDSESFKFIFILSSAKSLFLAPGVSILGSCPCTRDILNTSRQEVQGGGQTSSRDFSVEPSKGASRSTHEFLTQAFCEMPQTPSAAVLLKSSKDNPSERARV